MPRALVTGLSGFIGKQIAPLLIQRGYEVHGVGRGARPAELAKKANWHTLDLLDFDATRSYISELAPSHCLNLAWDLEHGKFWRSPKNLCWVQASLNLLAAFGESGGSRFVGVGSCAEYDWSYGFLTETITPRTAQSAFGQCKNAVFDVTMAHADVTKISAAWGRIFFVYGPHEIETRLVPHVIANLLAGRRAPLSHGEQIRDFSHVSDIAGGLVALLNSDVRGAVNIGSGCPVTVKSIARKIADYLGRPDLVEFGAIPAQPGEPPLILADVRRLREEVNFRPIWDLESGIRDTVDHYRSVFQTTIARS